MNLQRGEKLLVVTLAIALLHHTDHILRVDHSGWPLLPRVSPFTYSLLTYPVFLSIFLARSKPWYRVIATGVLFLFATGAHIFFEPMRDKYQTWTYGSNLPWHAGKQNLLHFNSPVIGVLSIVIAVSLSVSLLFTLVAFIKEARHKPV